MANAPDRAATDLNDRDFDAGALVRTASWGIGAAGALFLAVLAGLSDAGALRVAIAVSTLTGTAEKTVAAPAPVRAPVAVVQPQPAFPPQLVAETRRLHEQVRLLAADRDRLIQRIGALERNLEDVTGSIRRQEASAAAKPPAETPAFATTAAVVAPPTPPWPATSREQATAVPWAALPPVEAPPESLPEATAALPPATPLPLPRPTALDAPEAPSETEAPEAKPSSARQAVHPPTPDPAMGRTAYGVDLGGAVSIDRLRLLWQSLRTNEPRLLQGLRPITHIRETRRGGRPDVRLILGPLANADQAARLCAAILNAGRYCEPAVYRGQRLSTR